MAKTHAGRIRSGTGPAPTPPPPRRRRRLWMIAAVLGLLAAAAGVLRLTAFRDAATTAAAAPVRHARNLEDLLKMPPEGLADVDIAEMNLLCATGLPGAENLDIDRCLSQLDDWARRVKAETDRYLPKFRLHPDQYRNSEGYYRALMLVTVLEQDCGVHYNRRRTIDVDFTRSQDLFILGMIGNDNGGTCVSMPVLYVAVGRRLAYPLKIVLTKGHVFCRWDDPQDRFNIEATNQGLNSFDDAYYKTWPYPITDAQVAAGRYLLSLAPTEELALFLATRGHCLLDTGNTRQARDAYAAANLLAPHDPAYLAWMRQADSRLGR